MYHLSRSSSHLRNDIGDQPRWRDPWTISVSYTPILRVGGVYKVSPPPILLERMKVVNQGPSQITSTTLVSQCTVGDQIVDVV